MFATPVPIQVDILSVFALFNFTISIGSQNKGHTDVDGFAVVS